MIKIIYFIILLLYSRKVGIGANRSGAKGA